MKLRFLASLGALTVVLGAGCSGGAKDLCRDRQVRCEAPNTCDPSDGVCKCGGVGGVACPESFVCDVTTSTCLSTLCGDVQCGGGAACDINDGVCKCGGTGGTECSNTQVCDPAIGRCVAAADCSSVTCPSNETCDAVSGSCVCGPTACEVGQTCVITDGTPTCAEDRCSGVTCVGSSVCDPADGFCKCNGAICKGGEACACPAGADGGCAESARVCRPGSACTGVTCSAGLTCDPADGVCKCGGPGGPACSSAQLCELGPPAQCQGGQQCQNADGGVKSCGGGTSCDPEDGLCKCGGRGGQVCDPGTGAMDDEICISSTFQQACRQRCNPTAPSCPTGQFCYFDSSATNATDAYCIAAATPTRFEGDGCDVPNQCVSNSTPERGLHCNGLSNGISGICRLYCDTTGGEGVCPQVPAPQSCQQITNAPSGVGFCRPLN